MMTTQSDIDFKALAALIKQWGLELGFQQVGICDCDLSEHEHELTSWLDQNYHGEMKWMAENQDLRLAPDKLVAGTLRVISVRMNYLPEQAKFAAVLGDETKGYISRYALGRDYHKVLRKRLTQLAEKIKTYCASLHYRPFVDSAPVLERPLAEKAGLGWQGKHTLLIHHEAGSWFFLGEILVNIPLPVDQSIVKQCGECQACLSICPTQAIVEPYVIDARRCISYLTIEYKGVIPQEFRSAIGNRIYGCDDCQLICPWNRYASVTTEKDFAVRKVLHTPQLLELYHWDEATFLKEMEGSAIRRIGYLYWLRNITIALGNAAYDVAICDALIKRQGMDPLLDEHIDWALAQQNKHHLYGMIENRKKARLIRSIEKGLTRDA